MMIVYSTADVPLAQLREVLADDAAADQVRIDEHQFFFKSMEPPSWIHMVASLPWWEAAIAGVAATVASGFLHEAGREAWRKLGELPKAAAATSSALWSLAERIVSIQQLLSPATRIRIGFPLDDEFHPGLYEVEAASVEEVAQQLARFSLVAGTIQEFLASEDVQPCGSIMVNFSEGGDVTLGWQDRETLEPHLVEISRS